MSFWHRCGGRGSMARDMASQSQGGRDSNPPTTGLESHPGRVVLFGYVRLHPPDQHILRFVTLFRVGSSGYIRGRCVAETLKRQGRRVESNIASRTTPGMTGTPTP